MGALPRSAGEFTLDWINTALSESGVLGDHKVTRVNVLDSDIPGQTAEVARLELEYDDTGCELPRHIIAKYTSRNQVVIDSVINAYQQYWRETASYAEFPDIGIARPRCLYSKYVPESQEFVLLMNDLAPAASPSWASTPEQVAMAAAALPPMHARWWNSPVLREKDWLVQLDNRDFFRISAQAALGSVPKVKEVFGDDAAETCAMMEWHAMNIEADIDHLATRPFTLVHGDFHPKQLFFPTDAGGDFAVIDWQFSFVAQGAWDLARIVTVGQDTASRRANEDALLANYLEGLKAAGVTDYTREDLENDFRYGILVNQMIMTIATGDTDIELVRRECESIGVDFAGVVLLRGEAALKDWNVFDYFRDIANGNANDS